VLLAFGLPKLIRRRPGPPAPASVPAPPADRPPQEPAEDQAGSALAPTLPPTGR
jgi:hypothetical protein